MSEPNQTTQSVDGKLGCRECGEIESTSPAEKIRSAAIRKDGVTYVCWAHTYNELARMNLDFPEDGLLNCEQGFVTNTGRFVDRVEGLAIATAANQIFVNE